MNICVQGLWHLGAVTSAGLASLGHNVIGYDSDQKVIQDLLMGKAPIYEPGLDELISLGLQNDCLTFTTSPEVALRGAEILWITFDTPVNDDDIADVDFVLEHIKSSLRHLSDGTIVLISSQVPVGTIKILEKFVFDNYADKEISFAYSPENLRLGKALDIFLNPDRIIVGIRNDATKAALGKFLRTISANIEWMSVESAEMTKHAINAFLAVSVTFINEIASICELVGADAKEVERGLKTESRIGPKAYLSPGGSFAGGTLARDIQFLGRISESKNLRIPLLASVQISNDAHKEWPRRILLEQFSSLKGVSVGIWGLTYKAGTDTLRRSLAIELCEWLVGQGAIIRAYDPAVKKFPPHWNDQFINCPNALSVLNGAKALVIGTEWPEFKDAALSIASVGQPSLVVIDANRFLHQTLKEANLVYISVGSTIN